MVKDHQREKYNIEECLSDNLIYYNDRVHSTTKVAPYVAMMNVGDKEFLKKLEKILLIGERVQKFYRGLSRKNLQ